MQSKARGQRALGLAVKSPLRKDIRSEQRAKSSWYGEGGRAKKAPSRKCRGEVQLPTAKPSQPLQRKLNKQQKFL